MKNIGYWTPFDSPESATTLVYLLHRPSRQQADASWKAFGADPAWRRVRQGQRQAQTTLSHARSAQRGTWAWQREW